MKHEEIEMQLWEFIDGSCDDADRQRISALIASDATWQEKYQELTALHENIAGLEAEQPSLRFNKNVMDSVNRVQIAPATKKYININVIRSITALFVLMIASVLSYAIANGKWNTVPTGYFTGLNLTAVFSSNFLEAVICINIILVLALIDLIFRKLRLSV